MWTSGGRVGAAGPDFPHARYGRRGCPAPPAGSRLGRVRRAAAPRAPIPPSRVGLDARRVLRVPRAGADRRGPARRGRGGPHPGLLPPAPADPPPARGTGPAVAVLPAALAPAARTGTGYRADRRVRRGTRRRRGVSRLAGLVRVQVRRLRRAALGRAPQPSAVLDGHPVGDGPGLPHVRLRPHRPRGREPAGVQVPLGYRGTAADLLRPVGRAGAAGRRRGARAAAVGPAARAALRPARARGTALPPHRLKGYRMFVCSRPSVVLDHFRVPYEVVPAQDPPHTPLDECVRLVADAEPTRSMRWPTFADGSSLRRLAGPPRRFRLGSLVLYGRLLADDDVRGWLPGWHPEESPSAGDGPAGSVWRDGSGGVFLPFDPDEVVTNFWSEGYQVAPDGAGSSRLRSVALAGYYLLRPLVPRPVQISARRLYSRVQARTPFPRWPVEPSLHGFYDRVLGWAAEVAGTGVPYLAPWPAGHRWALVLTHDVETDEGLRRLPVLRDIELAAGYRSSWNLVPGRYAVPDDTVTALRADGFEVGLHGLYHDGRDLVDGVLQQRLPQMRQWAQRWQASGFRAPATRRAWATMAMLPFEYDSSYPDTDPFEPQPGGCCSWLPYFNGPLVELPITLPQDHTLFVILRHAGAQTWIDKSERIRDAGGMALLITHPDYLGTAPIAEAYAALLARFADDTSVWRALPVEVNRWWRRRAQTRVARDNGGWRAVGPAEDEARVAVTTPVG